MKKTFLVIALLIFGILIAESTPTIVAVVNGERITSDFLNIMADLNRILIGIHDLDQKFYTALTTTPEGLAFLQRYRRMILDELIDQLLIQQLAEREGVKPDEKEIKERVEKDIEEALKKIGMSEEDFKKYLETVGMDLESLKKKLEWMYRTDESLKNLKEKVTKDATVSEDEIRSYYEKIKERRKAHLFAIFTASEEEAKEALKRIENGESFEEVASSVSLETTSAASGGDLGFLDEEAVRQVFGEDIAKRIFSASEGAILGPYKSGKIWVIFKVEKIVVERLDYDEVKKDIEKELLEKKKEEIWNRWWKENFEEFKKSSEIEIKLGGG